VETNATRICALLVGLPMWTSLVSPTSSRSRCGSMSSRSPRRSGALAIVPWDVVDIRW